MTKFLAFLCFIIFISCSENNSRELSIQNETYHSDTLRFNEDMRLDSRLDFTWDKFTIDSLIPRETWVKLNIKGIGVMTKILEHSNLFFDSDDSACQIKKISNNEFRVFVQKNIQDINLHMVVSV